MNSVGITGSPSERRRAASGQLGQGCGVAGGCAAHALLTGEAGQQLALANEVHEQGAGVLMQGRVFVGSQNLGRCDAHAVQAAGSELGATDGLG